MVNKQSILNVIDNSGIRFVKCVGFLNKKKIGCFGNILICIVIQIKKNQVSSYKKGSVVHCLLVQSKKPYTNNLKNNGIKFCNSSKNSVVLVDKKNSKILYSRCYGGLAKKINKVSKINLFSYTVFLW